MTDRRFRVFLVLVALIAAAALVVAGWAFYARSEQTKHVWRSVVCRIEMAVTKQKLPAAKEQAALRFYDRLLVEDVKTTGCGLVERKP